MYDSQSKELSVNEHDSSLLEIMEMLVHANFVDAKQNENQIDQLHCEDGIELKHLVHAKTKLDLPPQKKCAECFVHNSDFHIRVSVRRSPRPNIHPF